MKKVAALLALALAALALVACGSSSSSSTSESTSEGNGGTAKEEESEGGKEAEGGSAGSSSVSIEANPEGNLEFVQKTASAKAGKVTVDFANASPVPHDVAIESEGGETLGQTEVINGGSDSTVVNLKPGTYTFYCTIPGHREAGMEGTLTVK
jgi:plastocyanin